MLREANKPVAIMMSQKHIVYWRVQPVIEHCWCCSWLSWSCFHPKVLCFSTHRTSIPDWQKVVTCTLAWGLYYNSNHMNLASNSSYHSCHCLHNCSQITLELMWSPVPIIICTSTVGWFPFSHSSLNTHMYRSGTSHLAWGSALTQRKGGMAFRMSNVLCQLTRGRWCRSKWRAMGHNNYSLGPILCWSSSGTYIRWKRKQVSWLFVELLWTRKDRPLVFKTWWWVGKGVVLHQHILTMGPNNATLGPMS